MRLSLERPPLEVFMLGIVDFKEVQQLQRRLVYEIGDHPSASLILCEHPPTISVGRDGSRAHIVADDDLLKSLGIRVHWVNRGGGCVLHLPGQITAYLALPLDVFGLTLGDYLDRLHGALVNVLGEFQLQGSTRPDVAGIFLGESRVATVGVAVSRWIAYHGITLNVGPRLDLFHLLHESGGSLGKIRQTSMESRRQRTAPMSKVRESLIRNLEQGFGLADHHIYTSHPMIRRKVLSHVYAPSPG